MHQIGPGTLRVGFAGGFAGLRETGPRILSRNQTWLNRKSSIWRFSENGGTSNSNIINRVFMDFPLQTIHFGDSPFRLHIYRWGFPLVEP